MAEPYTGTVWRHLPATDPCTAKRTHPLNYGRILSARGRWNLAGAFGCLYTSLSPRDALGEYRKACRRNPPFQKSERVLVSIEVEADPVLDLKEESVRKVEKISRETLRRDELEDIEACRKLSARIIYDYVGLLAPSAALEDESNLMIYESTPGQTLRLRVGSERIPIQKEIFAQYDLVPP